MWDVASSNRIDYFIANSNHVAKRIEKYYRRKSDVIYPPVDCDKFSLSEIPPAPPFLKGGGGGFYLIVSAFAPYKRIDIAIEAFNRIGLPLKIIGNGQDEKRLKKLAKSNIEFLGLQNDPALNEYYSKCKALIFPGEEDFGIAPVEAMASGRPVIAYGKGGAVETVIPLSQKSEDRKLRSYEDKNTLTSQPLNFSFSQSPAPTGVFFHEQTAEALIEAVKFFEDNQGEFDRNSIRNHALKFDRKIFKEKIRNYIMEKYMEHGFHR